jgi:hypothetical protein
MRTVAGREIGRGVLFLYYRVLRRAIGLLS